MSFRVGQLVCVASRTGPYENKPGGVSTIIAIESETGLISVKYSLGGREKGIHSKYLTAHNFDDVNKRSTRDSSAGLEKEDGDDSVLVEDDDDEPEFLEESIPEPVIEADDGEVIVIEEKASTIRPILEPKKKSASAPIVTMRSSKCSKFTAELADVQNVPLASNVPNNEKEISCEVQDEELQAKKDDYAVNDSVIASSDVVAKIESLETKPAVQSSDMPISDEVMKMFNHDLRKLFDSDGKVALQRALTILSDINQSRKILQTLHDQDRVFVQEQYGLVWKV